MSQRSDFQVQILEKLGAPLLIAAADVVARQKKDGQNIEKQEAERVAELLNKAVQASVNLAGSMDLKDSGAQADSVRLALAAVTGQLVAGQYKLTGKMPNDKDIGRLVKALEAVLTFSDNFVPATDNTVRLENIEPGAILSDENQINIQLVNALVPVVNIIASFPFGHPENKLVQEVASKLIAQAATIQKSLLSNADGIRAKQAELNILKALAALYVECHQEEINKLMAMDEQARAKAMEVTGGVLPMDPVWQAFEIRAGMIEVIGKSIAQKGETVVTAGTVTPTPPPQQEQQPAPQEEPLPPAKTEPEENEGAFNPMGFFKPGAKPTSEDNNEGEEL